MHNANSILGISTLVVILVDVVLVFRVTVASYGTVFAKRNYAYRFDKTKLPLFAVTLVAAVFALFSYGFLIARDVSDATGFCLINTAILSIGIFIASTYRKKDVEHGKGGDRDTLE